MNQAEGVVWLLRIGNRKRSKQETSFKYVDRCAWEEISIVLGKINVRADLQFRRLERSVSMTRSLCTYLLLFYSRRRLLHCVFEQ